MANTVAMPEQVDGSHGSTNVDPNPEVAAPADTLLELYRFPTNKLKGRLKDSSKTPLVLVACGSFNPITLLHLRMFEMASDWIKFNTDYEVVGGYLSPVGDAYMKAGLAAAAHRIAMCQTACDSTSKWIMVDTWEPMHKEYVPTRFVLDHFNTELNEVCGGIMTETGEQKRIHVSLLAGADLIQTMSTPGVWSPHDLEHILGIYGAFIIERAGTDIDGALASLRQWKDNIHVVPQLIQNDVSSTKIRLFLKRDMSVHYLIPEPVIDYIYNHGLYFDDSSSTHEGGKADDGKGKT